MIRVKEARKDVLEHDDESGSVGFNSAKIVAAGRWSESVSRRGSASVRGSVFRRAAATCSMMRTYVLPS